MFLAFLSMSAAAGEPEPPAPPPPEAYDEVLVVTASRASGPTGEMPVSGTVLTAPDIAQGRPTLELGEVLSQVPGVFVANRGNFAQDSRISIRGFGTRAPFGVRGIRVLLDGIPLTLPDGQSQLDLIDPANLGRVEVLRGPSGSAWGNAAGGILSLTTRRAAGPGGVEIDASTTVGSFGLWKATAALRSRSEATDVSVFASRTQLAGWRAQSELEQVVAQVHVGTQLTGDLRLITNVHFVDSPVAGDPGGLTPEDAARTPRAAAEVNREFGTGEAVRHVQAGTRFVGTVGPDHQVDVVGYAGLRAFDGAIPFRTVQFDRDFFGGLATWRWSVRGPVDSRLVVGAEAQAQHDDRRNEGNDGGVPDGTLSLSQDERATNVGAFVQERLGLGDRVVLLASGRYDRVAFSVEDRIGDGTGARRFDEVTGQGGILVKEGLAQAFANVSQSFETPTISELVVAGGLDATLRAQRALQVEAGGRAVGSRLSGELTGFWIGLDDELLRQEDDEGRAFFTNIGRSRRIGAEARVRALPVEELELVAAYTWLRAEFRDEGRVGRRVPGLPEHLGFLRATWRPGSCSLAAESELVGSIFADDANLVQTEPTAQVGVRGGCGLDLPRRLRATLQVGLRNLLGVDWIDNVRINATGERYLEPGPPRSVFARLTVSRR